MEEKERTDKMTFQDALSYLKRGDCVCRVGWYGKHYIELISTGTCSIRVDGKNEPSEIPIDPFIAIFPQNGGCIPWFASQADLSADDWEVVD